MTAIAELPGPRPLPVLGNALQLRPDRLHVMIEQWGRRYGPVFRFSMGPREVVAFTDPEAVNAILRERPRRLPPLARAGERSPRSSGSSARSPPRATTGAASAGSPSPRSTRTTCGATSRSSTWPPSACTGGCRPGRRPAILDDFMSYSVDVTSALAFGHDLNTLERGDGELQRHITRVFELLARRIAVAVPYWHVFKPPADRAAERSLASSTRRSTGFIARPARACRPARSCARRPRTSSRACCPRPATRPRRVRQRLHDAARGRGHDREHARLGDVPARPRPGRAARGWRPRPTPCWATTGPRSDAEDVDGCTSPRPSSARRRG